MATVAADLEGQAVLPTSAKLTLLPLIAPVGGHGWHGRVRGRPR